MKPIVGSKTILEYTCPKCNKKSTYESEINKCIYKHKEETLYKECNHWGSQAYFKDEEQANRFVKMKENELNMLASIPMSVSDDYTAKLEWVGPGCYHYHANLQSKHWDYDSYEILFKRGRS